MKTRLAGLMLAVLAGSLDAEPPRRFDAPVGAGRFQSKSVEAGPFDLTYLPQDPAEIQALFAIRPAAIFANPAAGAYVAELNAFLRQVGGSVGIRTDGPGIENIESIILCGNVNVTANADPATKADKPSSLMLGANGGLVRTLKPHDWLGTIRRWFPQSAIDQYRGRMMLLLDIPREYLPESFRGKEPGRLALLVADDRTLVVDGEKTIRELLDRVDAGKTLPPPPGWEKVCRNTLALCIDNFDKRWIYAMPKPKGPERLQDATILFRSADYIALGLVVGESTRLSLSSYSVHPFEAAEAWRGSKPLRKRFADHFAHNEEKATPKAVALTKAIDGLLLEGKTTRTPLGFEYKSEVSDDLVKRLIEAFTDTTAVVPVAGTR